MKKSLVLAMAMALGVTASAYAANPFSDVPAGHWAYDAVNKLAAEGVVDGYPDGTYGGDKLNVKITGQIRAAYGDSDEGGNYGKLRTRLFLNGQINEDWTYTARFQNEQDWANGNSGEDDVDLNWAYVSGRVGGVKTDLGRQNLKLHTGNVLDAEFDAIKVAYGDKVKVTGFVGKAEGYDTDDDGDVDKTDLKMYEDGDRLYVVDVTGKIGVVDAYATYYNLDNTNPGTPFEGQEIYNVGVAFPVAKDLKLSGEYLYGTSDEDGGMDNSGWVAGLAYKGAKASKVGSWGVYANYYDMPALTYFDNTNNTYTNLFMNNQKSKAADGFEGYEVGANVTLAKNIVAAVKYYDLDAREDGQDDQAIWSEVVFTF